MVESRMPPAKRQLKYWTPLRLRERSGFTLIEVALASTILLVGFVGMIEALAVGSEMLDTARKQNIAGQIVQGEVEYLRMQSWSAVSSLASTAPDYLSNYPEFSSTSLATVAGTTFTFSRQVISPNPHPNIRQVALTISWTSITGKPHTRSCNAYVGKFGLDVAYQKP